jgi:hypothetical protein
MRRSNLTPRGSACTRSSHDHELQWECAAVGRGATRRDQLTPTHNWMEFAGMLRTPVAHPLRCGAVRQPGRHDLEHSRPLAVLPVRACCLSCQQWPACLPRVSGHVAE